MWENVGIIGAGDTVAEALDWNRDRGNASVRLLGAFLCIKLIIVSDEIGWDGNWNDILALNAEYICLDYI